MSCPAHNYPGSFSEVQDNSSIASSMLPQHSEDVPAYLEARLDTAFAYFLEREKDNPFAKVGKEGWELSKDPDEELSSAKREQLEKLKNWLSQNMRTIK